MLVAALQQLFHPQNIPCLQLSLLWVQNTMWDHYLDVGRKCQGLARANKIIMSS